MKKIKIIGIVTICCLLVFLLAQSILASVPDGWREVYWQSRNALSTRLQQTFSTAYKCEKGHIYTSTGSCFDRYNQLVPGSYTNNTYNHTIAPLKLETSLNKCPYAGCGAAPKETLPNKNIVYVKSIDVDTVFNNIYCVEHDKSMGRQFRGEIYEATAKIEIKGNIAKVYKYNTQTHQYDYVTEINNTINNKIAAIVSADGITKGHMSAFVGGDFSTMTYNTAQKLLYDEWNNWITTTGIDQLGLDPGPGNETGKTDSTTGDKNQLENALSNGKLYSATLYFIKYNAKYNFFEYETWYDKDPYSDRTDVIYSYPAEVVSAMNNDGANQHLILVHIPVYVTKIWDDNNNSANSRPESIQVGLFLEDGTDTGKRITLSGSGNTWEGVFENLSPEVNYTVKEIGYTKNGTYYSGDVPGYEISITGNKTEGYTITNKMANIPVTKVWKDTNNSAGLRPESIQVGLFLKDGTDTGKTVTLNESNEWKGVFENISSASEYVVKEIGYTINGTYHEGEPIGYGVEVTGNPISGYIITNTIKVTEIPVTKIWNDNNNRAGKRPSEIVVKLLADGEETGKTLTLNNENNWSGIFGSLQEYNSNGSVIKYSIEEVAVEDYSSVIIENSTGGYNIINTYYHGYIEISGRVWNDGSIVKSNTINGIYDSNENGIEGIEVILKNADGTDFTTGTEEQKVNYKTKTGPDGTYTFLINLDNNSEVYKLYENADDVKDRIQTAYVEFGYNGMKYTTVKNEAEGENTSKAIEDETKRKEIDEKYSTISPTTNPSVWDEEKITASTKNVIDFETYTDKHTEVRNVVLKKCIGDSDGDGVGEDINTNTTSPWNDSQTEKHNDCKNKCENPMKTFDVDVGIIKNVNLGLFEKEQPRIELASDVNRVIVEMNGQDYTYLYRNRGLDSDGMKVKYEGNDYYTNSQEYMRPINVSDVAYMLNKAEEVLKIYVVYELKLANTSNSVEIKVDDIINFYDPEYELISVTNVGKQGNPKQEELTNYETGEGEGYKTLTLKGLSLTLKAGEISDKIEIKYKVNKDTIIKLLQEQATLEHVSEILSYANTYGTTTLYAEQRTHETEVEKGLTGRGGTPYAGYDYEAHPGNAEIYYHQEWNILRSKQAEEAYIAKNGKGIESKAQKAEEQACAEHDTDFAPSFILKVGDAKTLSGTVYEDKDVNLEDEERLGNGKFDEGEKTVGNVKVELYNIDGTPAKLYKDINSTGEDAVTYTNENGEYALKGVVTSEYFVKFTYGDDTEKLGHEATTIDGTTTINARNYKSTIITNEKLKEIFGLDYSNERFDKNWHINIEDNYSVAVDNMLERTEIKDLQYSNFGEKLNMTAYTKPFSTEVEFDADGEGQSDKDGNIAEIELEDKTNLNKLDFGIAERPREDLFVEKTIKYMKLVLANGQTLIDGDPRSHTLNYAKAIGFDQEITSGEAARRANPKRLLIEMDVELIQGSKLELQYEIKVTNNNELDYDYGTSADYTDIVIAENKFITTSDKAKYYYFGEKAGLNENDEIKATIELVDYLKGNIIYEVDTAQWLVVNANDLRQEGNELISAETYEAIKDSRYKIFRSADTSITLSRKQTWTQDMTVSKSLANEDENIYDNSLEIIKIDGKTARTIQESDENGRQVEKSYKPGNYIPVNVNGEQDDDLVEVIITPPTGIEVYILTYLIAGLVGLIIIAIVVVFIKKNISKR